jgi:hypothetical protein
MLEELNCFHYLQKYKFIKWSGDIEYRYLVVFSNDGIRRNPHNPNPVDMVEVCHMLMFVYLYCSYFPIISTIPIYFAIESRAEKRASPEAFPGYRALEDKFALEKLFPLYKWVDELDNYLNNITSPTDFVPDDMGNRYPSWMFSCIVEVPKMMSAGAFMMLLSKALVAFNMFVVFEDNYMMNIHEVFTMEEMGSNYWTGQAACTWRYLKSLLCDSQVEQVYNLDRRANSQFFTMDTYGYSSRVDSASARNVVFVTEFMHSVIAPADEFWSVMMAYPNWGEPYDKLLPLDMRKVAIMKDQKEKAEHFKTLSKFSHEASKVFVEPNCNSFNIILFRKMESCDLL